MQSYLQTCFSIYAASSAVALGMIPGSVKLVLNNEPITKRNNIPDIIGITGVTFLLRYGQLKNKYFH